MKLSTLVFFTLLIFLAGSAKSQSNIYGQSVMGLDSFQYSLSSFKGLKIWIIVLPTEETIKNGVFLARVDSIALANAGRMATIVIPSFEDGYVEGVKSSALIKWYHKLLHSGVVISRPLFTQKKAEFRQSGLYHWLTSSKLNGRYDADARGPGSTYFISEDGELIGSFGPEAMFSDKVIRLVLR